LPESGRPLVVEGAGGALVPLNDRELMVDLMVRLGLPVIVAAADRLGGINHALLTLQALYAHRLPVLGVILTGGSFGDNAAAIEHYGRTPILARLPWADPLNAKTVEAMAGTMPPFPAQI
jgi:malonyl-CoA O-methyltransferase